MCKSRVAADLLMYHTYIIYTAYERRKSQILDFFEEDNITYCTTYFAML